jgi:transposase InsO family protein
MRSPRPSTACTRQLIHRRASWKTREAVEFETLEWVAWFNHHRLLEPLGYIPPAEAEANYYQQLSGQAMLPDSHQSAS